MKKLLLLLTATALLSSCSTATNGVKGGVSYTKDYGYNLDSNIVRKGKVSQRFEARHGDCGGEDCYRDRRRYERQLDLPSSNEKWFAWSIFLPKDYESLNFANTVLGQLKDCCNRKPPIIVSLLERENTLRFSYDISENQRWCMPTDTGIEDLDTIKGKWTDIMIMVSTDHVYQENKSYSKVFINGNKVCDVPNPVIDRSNHELQFTYGIYNSFISRWFDENKTTNVESTRWLDQHEGFVIGSTTNKPYDIDWGVKLPTHIVYFDEMRFGPSRESVDINMNEPVD
jgi:hypothetical protein